QVLPQLLLDRPSNLSRMAFGENCFHSQGCVLGTDGRSVSLERPKGPIVRPPGSIGSPMSSLPPRRGDYGFDAPYAPLLMALFGACLLALSAWRLFSGEMNSALHGFASFAPGVAGLWLFFNAGVFVYTTRVGKFAVWAELLDRLDLKGDER